MTRPAAAATRAVPPGATPPSGYYGYEGPPRRRRPVWPWVLSVILLLCAGAAAWFAYTKIQDQLDANKPVAVPQVAGLQEDLAVTKIREAGFTPQVGHHSNDTIPKGEVISQSPAAGQRQQKGNNVNIVVSTGKPQVQVPSVVGQSRDAAVAALTNAGLEASPVVDVPSSKPTGTVTGQEPQGGLMVVRGSRVRINVSSGPAEVDVPSVIGLNFDDASAALQNNGFAVARKNVDSDQPKDQVVDQDPSGQAPKGATITLSVSKGPKTSSVPDVTSQDEGSARSTLENAGFRVQVTHQPVTDPGLDGIVLDQTPTGGSQAPQGSTVRITVGQETNTAPPPPPTTP
jgi:serine/threonine-protein kinase